MAWGFIGFSSVSVTIAVLYMMGFLDKYCIFGGGRLVLFYENANAYSTRMVISMFFIAYLVANNPLRWGKYRFILLIAEFPLLYIVLASGSRGSLIFMLVGFLVYLSYLPMRRIAHKIALITVISLAGVGGVTYILNNNQDFGIMERMSRSIENGDDAGRSTLSAATLQIWSENPVFGVGAVDFSQQMFWRFRLTRTVHSVYWYTLVTTGICGLLALIFFLVILGREVFRVRHKDPMPLTLYVIMILLASKTGGALAYIIMWYVFAISATLSMRCLKK
ncbi:MAG: O-antigen ligase family protein [Muribaculaceae bacterium]|nr:O-antigen ligase family protein [Muribaculaceae bacterium]